MSNEIRAKFLELGRGLNRQFAERERVVNGMLCAALAQEHCLLLGPPGTAKSGLARAFAAGIGCSHFEWLMSKFTAPEELFGPVSLQGLKDERYQRITTGKLPEAEMVFLDEIFKANSAILNNLLSALNERVFHNGGKPVLLPLRMTVGASNELPDGPELAALYDRFLVRYWVDYLKGPDQFLAMVSGEELQIAQQLSIAEWDAARAQVAKLEANKDLYETLFRLRDRCTKDGIVVSDRRWKRLVRLAKASAWLQGDAVADSDHLDILKDALWTDPEQRSIVERLVDEAIGGAVVIASQVLENLHRAIGNVDLGAAPSARTTDWQSRLISLSQESTRAIARLKELATQAGSHRQSQKISAFVVKAEAATAPVKRTLKASLEL